MSDIPMAVAVTDAVGTLSVDLSCRQCGYNLRGLQPDSRCPECGTAVSRSMQADLLRFAHPEWVERVSLGMRVLLWMIVIWILGTVLAMMAALTLGLVFAELVALALAAIGYYGAWLLSASEPGGTLDRHLIRARKLVRVALLLGIGGNLISMFSDHVPMPEALALSLAILAGLAGLVSIAGEWAKFVLYENFAKRIPDTAMERRARFLRYAYAISLGVVVLGGAIIAGVAATAPSTTGLVIIGVIVAPAGVALLVFGLMTLGLLLRLNKALKEQAVIARQTWTSESTMAAAGAAAV